MTEKVFVTPAKQGSKVYDPDTKGFIPETGRLVPRSIYWLRRIRDCDVLVGKPHEKQTKHAKVKE